MIMDMGHWEELESGNTSAKISMALGVVFAVLAGVWIWF
jgi:succinate dehydrogenase / fumarate reductase cytochrome b subunit